MTRRAPCVISAVAAALAAVALSSGCGSDDGGVVPNLAPNTRVSAGPPEAAATSFEVNLFWFGWDDDGFVDHYEIAWETPDDWQGPIFGNDSLFVVEASDTCCVDPLPEYPDLLPDSVYSQYHTFYVRSVDDDGVPDETPAVRSFNAKTIAPFTEIIPPSPPQLGQWGTVVEFNWTGTDDDGLVVGYRYALTSLEDFIRDTGNTNPGTGEILAWLDTLTHYPDLSGGYFPDSLVWRFTEEDSVTFPNVNTTRPPNKYFFAVRAIDNAGAEEQILEAVTNVRFFEVTRALDGPNITITSNILGSWFSADAPQTREAFAGQGIRFRWRARPGPSEAPVAGFSIAIDDTSQWTPFSPTLEEFPEPIAGEEQFWFPEAGPHTFFVRAIDQGGFMRVLPAQIRIFPGPRFCFPVENRYILVVLDTLPGSLQGDYIWPLDYEAVELGLIQYYFEGYDYQVHETRGGREKPSLALMDCASTVFWLHSGDARNTNSTTMLRQYHSDRALPNPLPSYVASGGNLILCGLQPSGATRYFEDTETGDRIYVQNDPVVYQSTITDTTLADHWMATQFGIALLENSYGNTNLEVFASRRLRTCKSRITTGTNPYPDLQFDPMSWPEGPVRRGFGYYDRGLIPLDTGDPATTAQVIYTANDTQDAIALRKLTSPGANGNVVYLGFHPYFVERPAFRQLLRAILTDFGEFPTTP